MLGTTSDHSQVDSISLHTRAEGPKVYVHRYSHRKHKFTHRIYHPTSTQLDRITGILNSLLGLRKGTVDVFLNGWTWYRA